LFTVQDESFGFGCFLADYSGSNNLSEHFFKKQFSFSCNQRNVERFFAKTSPKINLIHVNDEKSEQSEKLIKSILKNKNDSLLFKVSTHSDCDSTIMLNASSVVIFDSVESFRELRDKIYWQTNRAVRYKHLVYIPEGSRSDLELIRFKMSFGNPNFKSFSNLDALF
jgi:hypothetical protein